MAYQSRKSIEAQTRRILANPVALQPVHMIEPVCLCIPGRTCKTCRAKETVVEYFKALASYANEIIKIIDGEDI